MEALKINNLIKILNKNYLSNKYLKKKIRVRYKEDDKALIINALTNAAIEILDFFSVFFLSGNYMKENIADDLSVLENYLEEKAQIILISEKKISEEIEFFFKTELIDLLKFNIIPKIRYFFVELEHSFSLVHRKPVRGFKDISTKSLVDGIIQHRKLFLLILRITKFEHYKYSLNEDTLRDFLFLKKEIEEIQTSNYIKTALLAKCQFLLKKMMFRAKECKSDLYDIDYGFNYEESSPLKLNSIELDGGLIDWETQLQIHYELMDDYKIELEKKVSDAYKRFQKGELNDYFSFYTLIKKFKDEKRGIDKSEDLVKEFQNLVVEDDDFSNYASKVSSQYLFNNKISLELEKLIYSHEGFLETNDKKNKIDLELIHNSYNAIIEDQKKTGVKNYFPWYSLCCKLSDFIDKLLDDLLDPKKFKFFKELKEIYINSIENLEVTVDWCLKRHFLTYQLTFIECQSSYIIKSGNYGDMKLFFYSSSLLPLNYPHVEKEKMRLQSKIIRYETLSTTYSKLKDLVNEVKDISAIQKSQERRSIEIIAIFSAISLFSVGSIQIIKTDSVALDPHAYYKFIFAFGYSLILFTIIIWIITRDNIRKVHIVHLILITILVITSLIVIGYVVGANALK